MSSNSLNFQVMMGDGQVSQGDMVVKPNATKVRKLADGRVLAGYAGSTADALTLMERLEGKLEEHEGTERTGREQLWNGDHVLGLGKRQ